ncbi:GrpB family protein [Rickettsiales endosymbiont of Stachyamoeba lipophora]|uniref:GrpB family protein n=1 Tax=Rickettsiales endosymbiont of Stachyamoeba lipophora TaxID=2486578 RepID=UPI0019D24B62
MKQAFGDNFLEIHHIGSTSVPGLAAKPTIDKIPVVKDILVVDKATNNMAQIGYEARGRVENILNYIQ